MLNASYIESYQKGYLTLTTNIQLDLLAIKINGFLIIFIFTRRGRQSAPRDKNDCPL